MEFYIISKNNNVAVPYSNGLQIVKEGDLYTVYPLNGNRLALGCYDREEEAKKEIANANTAYKYFVCDCLAKNVTTIDTSYRLH